MSQASIVTTPRPWSQHMRRQEASDYLREEYGISLSPATLAKMAVLGGGPPFRKDGRFPIHDRPDLDAFAVKRLGPLRTSTSDQKAA